MKCPPACHWPVGHRSSTKEGTRICSGRDRDPETSNAEAVSAEDPSGYVGTRQRKSDRFYDTPRLIMTEATVHASPTLLRGEA